MLRQYVVVVVVVVIAAAVVVVVVVLVKHWIWQNFSPQTIWRVNILIGGRKRLDG